MEKHSLCRVFLLCFAVFLRDLICIIGARGTNRHLPLIITCTPSSTTTYTNTCPTNLHLHLRHHHALMTLFHGWITGFVLIRRRPLSISFYLSMFLSLSFSLSLSLSLSIYLSLYLSLNIDVYDSYNDSF